MWNQTWLTEVNKGREIDTIVPVGCEVGDALSRKNCVQPQKEELLESLKVLNLVLLTSLCCRSCRSNANVVSKNQGPNDAESVFLVFKDIGGT